MVDNDNHLVIVYADNFMGRGMELMKPLLPELPQTAVGEHVNDPVRNNLPDHLRVCCCHHYYELLSTSVSCDPNRI